MPKTTPQSLIRFGVVPEGEENFISATPFPFLEISLLQEIVQTLLCRDGLCRIRLPRCYS